MAAYIPAQGDLIALSFDPQSGHEKKGRRPALVLSTDLFNRLTGLAFVCPITNTNRDLPFHVALAEASSVTGFVMVEQVKSIDYRSRRAKFIERSPEPVFREVLSILDAFLY